MFVYSASLSVSVSLSVTQFQCSCNNNYHHPGRLDQLINDRLPLVTSSTWGEIHSIAPPHPHPSPPRQAAPLDSCHLFIGLKATTARYSPEFLGGAVHVDNDVTLLHHPHRRLLRLGGGRGVVAFGGGVQSLGYLRLGLDDLRLDG